MWEQGLYIPVNVCAILGNPSPSALGCSGPAEIHL